MRAVSFLLVVVLASLSLALAVSPKGPETLVVYTSPTIPSTHSKFFADLESRGHILEFASSHDSDIRIVKHGEFLYSNLILFADSASSIKGLSTSTLIDFVSSGRNILLGGSDVNGKLISSFVNELGIEFDNKYASAIDHINYDKNEVHGEHTRILTSKITKKDGFFTKEISNPILYKGGAHTSLASSPFLHTLLSTEDTGFSYDPAARVSGKVSLLGGKTNLVSAFHSPPNNGRVVVSSSTVLFSNSYFEAEVESADGSYTGPTGNELFASEVSAWAFQERSFLRVVNLRYHVQGREDDLNPWQFRVNDDVRFGVQIQEWDGEKAEWVPFLQDDVQLQVYKQDPWIRKLMKHDSEGNYFLDFRVPDVFGVYQFQVRYQRDGFGFIDYTHKISLHPYKHDEYDRFLLAAYPYYAGAFSMMGGFFIFGVLFLYNKD